MARRPRSFPGLAKTDPAPRLQTQNRIKSDACVLTLRTRRINKLRVKTSLNNNRSQHTTRAALQTIKNSPNVELELTSQTLVNSADDFVPCDVNFWYSGDPTGWTAICTKRPGLLRVVTQKLLVPQQFLWNSFDHIQTIDTQHDFSSFKPRL